MPITIPNPWEAFYLLPEILLTFWGFVVLIVDLAAFRYASSARRRQSLGMLALIGTIATLIVCILSLSGALGTDAHQGDYTLFFGTLSGDASTIWLNLAITTMLALVIAISMTWDFTQAWGEYYGLLMWATVGMMLLIAAEELLTLFLALEMMTICLYLMTSLEKTQRRSAEAGLKYFIYGSVSSALFLFGLSLIYGLTGSTRLPAIRTALVANPDWIGLQGNIAGATAVLLVLVGFGFKVAAVPFHQWAPDVYEGGPAPTAAWVASGSKVASFVALMKILLFGLGPWATQADHIQSPGWVGILALIAAVSMTYGNFAALVQRNFKRMLAYSAVGNAGYILVGVLAVAVSQSREDAAGGVLYFVIVYAFTTIGAFAAAAWMARDLGSDEIDDLKGLGFRSPGMAACIGLLMLSLIGVPPFAGFWGKLLMFMEAMNTGESGRISLTWLVALGLFNSVVSAFYYIRVLKVMFFREPANRLALTLPSGIFWPVVAATAVVVGFGLYPPALLDPMTSSAIPMLSAGADQKFRNTAAPNVAYHPDFDESSRPPESHLVRFAEPEEPH